MKKRVHDNKRCVWGGALALVLTMLTWQTGCNSGATSPTAGAGPLSFDGSISGKVFDTQSTRGDSSTNAAGQSVPPNIDTANTSVRFQDVAGAPLESPDGTPFPQVDVQPDGSFDASGLPVGLDFTVCVDIGKDGNCDAESFVNIAADGLQSQSGSLSDARVDPLTTMVEGRLRQLLKEKGIRAEDLPFSPAALVSRISSAYTNLFEETGIDQTLALDEVQALTEQQLADLFDSVIPSGARVGMQMAEGNLDAALGQNVEDIAFGAAQVFLRAGFPIADEPGSGLDLSSFASLDGVETTTFDELFGGFRGGPMGGGPGGPIDLPPDLISSLPPALQAEAENFNGDVSTLSPELIDAVSALDPGLFEGPPAQRVPQPIIYISKFSEPDRNFVGTDASGGGDGGMPPLPVMNDHLLIEMARLQLSGAKLTIGELYDLLTDIDTGLGARLTYFLFDPNFFGPPLTVFETADGTGLALNMEDVFRGFKDGGFDQVDFESFQRKEAALRAHLKTLLAGTIPPSFDRLFDVLLAARLDGVDALAQKLRDARAHLPFSRSGPSDFFVVADGDKFKGIGGMDTVSAVTVNAEVTPDGRVLSVEYVPDGTGAYFLGFTERTEENGIVELIVRETGSFLHSDRGPVRLSIFDESIFGPVNGSTFAAFVSQSGNFYPGVNVSVVATDYVPEPIPVEAPSIEPIIDGTVTDGTIDGTTGGINDGTVDGIVDGTVDPTVDGTLDPTVGGTVDSTGTVSVDPVVPPSPAEFRQNNGPNDQIFVLASGVGQSAEPVRVDFNFATGEVTFNPGGRNLLMFLPDTEQTGLFALFNEDTGRPASASDPTDFFVGPIDQPAGFDQFFNDIGSFDEFGPVNDLNTFVNDTFRDDGSVVLADGTVVKPDGTEVAPDGTTTRPDGTVLPPGDQPPVNAPTLINDPVLVPDPALTDPITPAAFAGDVNAGGFIVVSPDSIIGLPIARESFTHVFGIDMPNPRYNSDGDPFFDDVNGNGVQDANEATAPFRPTLFDPADWRSTDIRLYYRRADNGAAVAFDEVAFDSATPKAIDKATPGEVELVARDYLPRMNAFRFGRPNTALNLLTAFAPAEEFNGTKSFNRDTKVDIFGALALINLVMDQVFNVKATVDVDGFGPLSAEPILTDANLFVAPVGDPFVLILDGFRQRAGTQGATP